ncbi:MAG: rod shape-determining protein [Clostridia bacterium]|jgi:rod shape-determining protein MreB|nr:rod shape-determining protein [Clostridia bacterium]
MSRKLAIDLGTSTIQIYTEGKGVILNEPSVIAVDKYLNKATLVGREAAELFEREPEGMEVVRPIRDGVISRFNHTVVMLKRFLKKSCGRTLLPPEAVIAVPSIVTDVEENAVRDAAVSAGLKEPFLIDEPVAAAIGAGIDVTSDRGHMIVDIGGGTTDIAVICSGGAVLSSSVRVAGDEMTAAIIKYVRNKYSLLIGERTAEEAKIAIGSVWRRNDVQTITVTGKNLKTRAPLLIELTSYDMTEALLEPVTRLIEEICAVIEKTPPELVSDIAENGIVMTGGGCQIYGLDKMISSVTGLPVRVADDPTLCVVIGAGKADSAGLSPVRHKYRK